MPRWCAQRRRPVGLPCRGVLDIPLNRRECRLGRWLRGDERRCRDAVELLAEIAEEGD